MMVNKLNYIEIDSYRGATQPVKFHFDPVKKITMIFGENGDGKSTIADSLIAICTDSWGSIDDRSSEDKKSFITSITSKPEKLKIILSTSNGDFSAKLASNESSLVKTPAIGIPSLRHLRRRQIIQLIDAQPLQRYEELKQYIDVSNISKTEDELRKAYKSINSELEALARDIQKATATLEKTWEAENKPNNSWKEWAKTEAEKDLSTETQNYNDIEAVLEKWKSVNTSLTKYTESKTKLETLQSTIETIDGQVKEKEKENTEQNSNVLKLLKEAQTYITATDEIIECPVCTNTIQKTGLLSSIKSRIDAMSSLEKLVNQLQEEKKKQGNASVLFDSSNSEYENALKVLGETLNSFAIPKGITKKESVNMITDTAKTLDTKKDEYRKNKIAIDLFFSALNDKAISIKKTLEQHNLIKQQYQAIIEDTAKAEKTSLLLEAAKKALEITESKRKEFIENELTSISKDVEQLYLAMHPNEGLGSIQLLLKPKVKNSLELKANFHTKSGIPPQSVYSESHLDTLGLAIFIALAKKYGTEDTILILDDVLMSVDENHLDKFISLLHDVSKSFSHVLITTHYRPWRDRYRNHRAPASEVHFIELRQWSIEKGIRQQNGKNAIGELKEALDSGDFNRRNISGLAGTTLENILDYLTVLYQCRLPRKPKNDFALRELLDSISAKLQKVLKVQHLSKDGQGNMSIANEVEIKPIIDRLKQLSAIRNQVGAHFNLEGSQVSDKDVLEFAALTLELAKTITCPETGAFPDRDKTGSYFETKSGLVRLHPLREPSN